MPENFDTGYLFGVVLGDGYLSKRYVKKMNSFSFGIKLAVTDIAFATRFAETLERYFENKPWRKAYTRTRKANPEIGMPETSVTEHVVSISSREWYDRIAPVKLGRDFSIIRSKNMEFRKGFLQGMLDSEGYISHQYRYTDIAGKDLALLESVAEIAREMGYKAKVYGPYPYARGVAHLRINDCLDKTVEK